MSGPVGTESVGVAPEGAGALQALEHATTSGNPEGIALAELVRAFHAQVQSAERVDLDEVGEFLAVAGRIALLKSSALLFVPAGDGIHDAEDDGTRALSERISLEQGRSFLSTREGSEAFPAAGLDVTERRPVEPRSPDGLRRAWADMQARMERPKLRVLVPAFVRLDSAIRVLTQELARMGQVSLKALLRRSTRKDAVVHFLAVLELVRRREVSVVQSGLFEEITIEEARHGRDAASRAG